MMKVDLKRLGHSEEWRRLALQARRAMARLLRSLLVDHSHLVDMAAVIFLLGVAVYLIIVLLFVPPSNVQVLEEESLQLGTKKIDWLVNWIEERERARSAGINLPGSDVFP